MFIEGRRGFIGNLKVRQRIPTETGKKRSSQYDETFKRKQPASCASEKLYYNSNINQFNAGVNEIEWIGFFLAACALSLTIQQMEKVKKLEKRLEALHQSELGD
ncbi:hypothetical protein ACTSEZ_01940 [Metabacillus sp. JX24]|uniref:hypothetical protein n=1 Tax=Metabacillus sp. JX24 TaxID=3240759 RepID=UPI00351004C9